MKSKHYLITGFGGIGAAIADALLAQQHQVSIFSGQPITSPPLQCYTTDLLNETSIAASLASLESLPDVIINTVGMLADIHQRPEKSLKELQPEWLWHSIEVNTLPTVYLARQINNFMSRHTALQLISFSARVSSIADNHLGGWYSYRMSKCALNMLIKNISIEWKRQYPKASIYGYHPGTVKTKLSESFISNVSPEKLFTPEQAANYFINVFADKSTDESGLLFDWDNQVIEF